MGVHRAIRGQGQVDDAAYVDPSAYVSASALVSTFAFVDRGAFIGATAYIGLRTIVGAGAHIGAGAFIGADCIICDKARIADGAVIVDGSTVLSDCCCDGGGSGGLDVPVLTFDSINVVGDKLAAYITTGKKKGTMAYVGNDSFAGQFSVQDYFTLVYGENLTADGLTVVNSPTFGTDGAQWKRMNTVNEGWLQKAHWVVDAVNGNDENTGCGATELAAAGAPLKTLAELNRRLMGASPGVSGQAASPVYHIYSDIPTTDNVLLDNVRTQNFGSFPMVQGKRVAIGADIVVTAYTAAVPAANTGFILAGVGLGTKPVGSMILNAADTKCAFITKIIDANTVQVSEPSNANAVTFSIPGTPVAFTVGETVTAYTLPIIRQYLFSDQNSFIRTTEVKMLVSNDIAHWGDSSPLITRCQFDGFFSSGGSNGQISACCFLGHGSEILHSSSMSLTSCAVLHQVLFLNGVSLLSQTNTLQGANGQFGVSDAGVVIFNDPTSKIGMFDCAQISIDVNGGSTFRCYDSGANSKIYGSGNTNLLFRAKQGGWHALPPSMTVTTTSVAQLSLAGISYLVTDIPINDTANMTGISDGS